MIKTEVLTIDGQRFIRTYSDKNVKIHGGYPEADYDEVVDPENSGRTYIETDIPVDDSNVGDAEALSILLGGAE